eukprot:GEMP01045151.1.p1 GENE.GEMP01045151.1~~GEMP01045151.1.p1  ORF type:complete len:536 (-),score=108.64 GEMP01045151.1:86-1693(-)
MDDFSFELEILRAVVHKQRHTHRRQGHLLGLQRVLKCGLVFVEQRDAHAFAEMKKWTVDCSGKLCGLIAHGHFLNYSLSSFALIARLITRAEHLVTDTHLAGTTAGTIDGTLLGDIRSSLAGDMGDMIARSAAGDDDDDDDDDDGDMGTCVVRVDVEGDVGMCATRVDDDGTFGSLVEVVDGRDEVIAGANVQGNGIVVDERGASYDGVHKYEEAACIEVEAASLLNEDAPGPLLEAAPVLCEIVPELLEASSPLLADEATGGTSLHNSEEIHSVDHTRIGVVRLEEIVESVKRIESSTADNFAEQGLSPVTSLSHSARTPTVGDGIPIVESVHASLDVAISSRATKDDVQDESHSDLLFSSPEHTTHESRPISDVQEKRVAPLYDVVMGAVPLSSDDAFPASDDDLEKSAPPLYDGDMGAVPLSGDEDAFPTSDDEEHAPSSFHSDEDMSLLSNGDRDAPRPSFSDKNAPASSGGPDHGVKPASVTACKAGDDSAVSSSFPRRPVGTSRLRRFRRVVAKMRRVRKNTHKRKTMQ